MTVLYVDAPDGASGDMLLGALVDLAGSEHLVEALPGWLGLPGVRVSCHRVSVGRRRARARGVASSKSDGRRGMRVVVWTAGRRPARRSARRRFLGKRRPPRHGTPWREIMRRLEAAVLPSAVRQVALRVYRRIGAVEARWHRVTLSRLHLHELGDPDAVVAIAGWALMLQALGIRRVLGSPLVLERGRVRTRHGWLPLPSPATQALLRSGCCSSRKQHHALLRSGCCSSRKQHHALLRSGYRSSRGRHHALLRSWPVRVVDGGRERVTPTAAALLGVLARPSVRPPLLRASRDGCGVGTRRFGGAYGVVRVVMGEVDR